MSTGLFDGFPSIEVPADSTVNFVFDVPPEATLKGGSSAVGSGELKTKVFINGEIVNTQEITALGAPQAQAISWFEVDLSPWSGQAVAIELVSNSEQSELRGFWIMPRIDTAAPWLFSDPLPISLEIQAEDYSFGDSVQLIGSKVESWQLKPGETAAIDLYWRPIQSSDTYAKVFMHLIDANGNLVAQQDVQPVNNAYPLPLWQPETIIRDTHQLNLPPDLPARCVQFVCRSL